MKVSSFEQSLESITSTRLPKYDSSYAVIPHGTIIEEIKNRLKDKGLQLTKETYNGNINNQIIQAQYNISNDGDNEIGLMLAFGNSYNKARIFKVSVGANVFVCDNGMIVGDMSNYSRKHTGNALNEAIAAIELQLRLADEHFRILCSHKDQLKEVTAPKRLQAELCGRLFMEDKIISVTQLSIIQRELEEPSFNYGVHEESGWYLYNAVTYALKKSHPLNWIEDHEAIHEVFINEFDLV